MGGTITSVTIPVQLTSFTAKKESNTIRVTSSEQNNSYFEVLRILEHKETQVIGVIRGKGTSSNANIYSFTDHHPVMGINYYQLKQVDYDGKTDLSEVLALNFSFGEIGFKVYAPSDEPYITLFVNSDKAATENRIADVSGKVLLQALLKLGDGQNTINLPLFVSKGIYLDQLQNKVVKFVK